jgi:hypothetical protein
MFASEDGALSYLETLDLVGKACQGQTLQLIWPLVIYKEKVLQHWPRVSMI